MSGTSFVRDDGYRGATIICQNGRGATPRPTGVNGSYQPPPAVVKAPVIAVIPPVSAVPIAPPAPVPNAAATAPTMQAAT